MRFAGPAVLESPDADVLLFLQDNGMSREEFLWFMNTGTSGFQVMGNDCYGGNEQLLLPDGTTMRGEDVLGWYIITLRYYRRYYKPVMHMETNVFDPDAAPRCLWKQWVNIPRMRRDGVPVLGFTWYSLIDQVDWNTQLAEKCGTVSRCGLFDTDRWPQPVSAAYRQLIAEFSRITAALHGKMFDFTKHDAVARFDV